MVDDARQLNRVERARQLTIDLALGPDLEAGLGECEEHGTLRQSRAAEATRELGTVRTRERRIEHDCIGPVLPCQTHGRSRIEGEHDGVVVSTKNCRECLGSVGVTYRHQDSESRWAHVTRRVGRQLPCIGIHLNTNVLAVLRSPLGMFEPPVPLLPRHA